MPEMFAIGTSALVATQRLLSTASHNIANLNTEGYSRQRVTLTQRLPQYNGDTFVGKGVDVTGVLRSASDYLSDNVRLSTTAQARASTFVDLSSQVDSLLSDGSFSPAMQNFFTAVQDASNDPSSTSARVMMLNAANTLSDRFKDLNVRFNAMNQNVNDILDVNVNKLNSLASSLASLNRDIVRSGGGGPNAMPNDLLDKRDELLRQISEVVDVKSTLQFDGSLNVFIGDGQLLVAGNLAVKVAVTPNALDGARREVSMVNQDGTRSEVSKSLTGGVLAGALQFRDEVLDPARNGIGRLAVVMAETLNAQHESGQDQYGAMGTALFRYGSPIVQRSTGSAGTLDVQIDPQGLGNLQPTDYLVKVKAADSDGNFTLSVQRLDDDSYLELPSGRGPFTVDGLVFTPGPTSAAGDRFLVQATKYAMRDFSPTLRDPLKLALANPVRASVSPANLGNASISQPRVLDNGNESLQQEVKLVFSSPTSFTVLDPSGQPVVDPVSGGAMIDLAYQPGMSLKVNGWEAVLTGAPLKDDVMTVAANSGARGDNANALAMLGLRAQEILDAGNATYQEAFSRVLGDTAARTQQATINRDALKIQTESARAARDQVSGVNLDEEAADLVRFQQTYQAAAQIISAADEAFKALINAMQR